MTQKQMSTELIGAYVLSAEDGDLILQLLPEIPYKYAEPIISKLRMATRANVVINEKP